MLQLAFKGLTDVGKKRELNEDNLLVLEKEQCFVVADGMGGHQAGETASKIAVDTIREYIVAFRDGLTLGSYTPRDPGEAFAHSIAMANDSIHQLSITNPQFAGMGTTATGIFFDGERVFIANVGDSRVYRLREGELKRMTEDHSLFTDYVKRNEALPEDEATFPYRNVITRALGVDANVEVDIKSVRIEKEDLFLICSDGLSGLVEDPQLEKIILDSSSDLSAAATAMIAEANNNGGDDNITLILARVDNL
jgi:PPM family protein phosphatase